LPYFEGTCDSELSLPGGRVTVTGNDAGDVAYNMCDEKSNLKGDEVQTCQTNGRWSGDSPICVPIDEDQDLCEDISFCSLNKFLFRIRTKS